MAMSDSSNSYLLSDDLLSDEDEHKDDATRYGYSLREGREGRDARRNSLSRISFVTRSMQDDFRSFNSSNNNINRRDHHHHDNNRHTNKNINMNMNINSNNSNVARHRNNHAIDSEQLIRDETSKLEYFKESLVQCDKLTTKMTSVLEHLGHRLSTLQLTLNPIRQATKDVAKAETNINKTMKELNKVVECHRLTTEPMSIIERKQLKSVNVRKKKRKKQKKLQKQKKRTNKKKKKKKKDSDEIERKDNDLNIDETEKKRDNDDEEDNGNSSGSSSGVSTDVDFGASEEEDDEEDEDDYDDNNGLKIDEDELSDEEEWNDPFLNWIEKVNEANTYFKTHNFKSSDKAIFALRNIANVAMKKMEKYFCDILAQQRYIIRTVCYVLFCIFCFCY